jgi:hypothetical protein
MAAQAAIHASFSKSFGENSHCAAPVAAASITAFVLTCVDGRLRGHDE